MRKEFQPKDITERILGKPIWDMVEILHEKVTDPSDKIAIKAGLNRVMDLFLILGVLSGFCFGCVFTWTILILKAMV